MLLKVIRWLLGRIILFVNWLSQPTAPQRPADEQAAIDDDARALKLYEFRACPFCVKVRRELRRLGVTVERRDAARVEQHRQQLIAGGGEYKVPCLRIEKTTGEPTWLYESNDIIAYLRQQFATR